MEIKISVIVPVYNTEKYLKKCIDSILNQSFEEFEIIIINDGSTDGSLAIIEEYQAKYDNIVVINKQNEGQGVARNKALEISKGEYIAFVDSDDYIECTMLQSMYTKSLKNDLDIVVCNYKFVDINGHRIRDDNILLNDNEIIDKMECIKRFLVTNEIEGFSWNKLFKKQLFDTTNIRYPEGMKYEDIPTIVSVLVNANRIGFINEEFYNYFLRENSTVSTKTKKNTEDYVKAYFMVGDILEKNFNDRFQNEYDYFYSSRIVNIVYEFLKINSNREENKLFAKGMIKYINKISKYRICFLNIYYKKIQLFKVLIKMYLYNIYVAKYKLK